MDQIDKKILNILQKDSRLTQKEIGDLVHRTGQAVGNRITRLIEQNIIKQYTINVQYEYTQFIRIMMNNTDFDAFENFISQQAEISQSYKVAGSACYMLIAHFNQHELHLFFENISQWGTYAVDHVIKDISPSDLNG